VSDTTSSHWADAGLDDDAALIAATALTDGDGVVAKFFHELVISCRGLTFEPPNGGTSLPRLGDFLEGETTEARRLIRLLEVDHSQ